MVYKQKDYIIPPEKMIRVIISTDAKNEADDQYAIVHSILSPKFDIRGIIAAHFGVEKSEHSMLDSYNEILKLFRLMNIKPNIVKKGSEKALTGKTANPSEGSDLIVHEAMRTDTSLPLYVTVLGPLTDVASAYLQDPRIKDRITVIWIGGGIYPDGCEEYNLKNDIEAASVVFDSGINIWQVPMNVYQQMLVSIAELCLKVKPQGEIGNYLFNQMVEWGQTYFGKRSYLRSGECWYLGDSPTVGLLLNEHPNDYDLIPAPHITPEMKYISADSYDKNRKKIRVYHHIDSRFILEDMYSKLQLFKEDRGEIIYN